MQCSNKHFGALAQLVEHRTENPCVPGSIPGGTTFPPFIMNPCLRDFSSRGFSIIINTNSNHYMDGKDQLLSVGTKRIA